MAFKLDDEKNWGEFVHEHALDEMADQVEANRVKNVEQDQRLDEHDQHLAKLDEDLATETRERKAADEAEKQAREAADEAEKTAREQADQAEKTAREAADEAEKEAREKADADEAQARQIADEAEKTAREQADEAEKTAREAADEAEKEAREKADADEVQARQDADTAEQTVREQADQILQTQVTANTTKNADQDNRLANNDEKDAEQDTRLTNNDTRDNQQDARLDGLETKNTTQDSRLAALEAKPDDDIYPTAIEILDADYEGGKTARIKITQNDESKSLEENLPQPALDYEDETGRLTLTYLNESNSVTLPKSTFDPTPLQEEIAVQEHLREIDNKVIKVSNMSAVHVPSYYLVNKFGGEFVTSIDIGTNVSATVYELNSLITGKRSQLYDISELFFVNTLTEDIYVQGTHVLEADALNHLNPTIVNKKVGVFGIGETNILSLAPVGTVLYQYGFNTTAGVGDYPTLAMAHVYNMISRDKIAGFNTELKPDEIRTVFADYIMEDGKIHLPLVYSPVKQEKNISELDVPEDIKTQVGQLPDGYELRMYEVIDIFK